MAISDSLATVSDHLFSTAVAGYSLGIMLFAGNYAFGTRKSQRKVVEERALVKVGAATEVDPPAEPPTEIPDEPKQSRFGLQIGRWGVGVTCAALAVHITSVVIRGVAVDRLPWGNMFEFASLLGVFAVSTFLIMVGRKPELRFLGLFILPPVVAILVLAGLKLYATAAPVVAALRSYWLAIHVTAACLSSGILLFSGVLSILYLIRAHHDDVEARAGHPVESRVAGHLPPAATLDRLASRTVTFAFPIWTFAIIAGAIWAESAWGRYWGWDPKETWAFISWVVYAAYLHARATVGWKGKKAAWLCLLGSSTMLFNFVIVNVFISGLHSYAGVG